MRERPQHPRALSGLRPLEYPRFSVLIEPRCCDVLSQSLVVLPWPPSCSPKCAASSSTSSLPSVTAHRPLPPAPPRFLESPSFLRHADRFNLILLVFLYTWRDVVFHACQAVCLHLPPVRGNPPRLGAGARLYGLPVPHVRGNPPRPLIYFEVRLRRLGAFMQTPPTPPRT